MKNLNITPGEYYAMMTDKDWVIKNDDSIFASGIIESDDAVLICNAIETYKRTGKAPSELAEENQYLTTEKETLISVGKRLTKEMSELEAENERLREALTEINGMCADAGKVPDGKINIGMVAKISFSSPERNRKMNYPKNTVGWWLSRIADPEIREKALEYAMKSDWGNLNLVVDGIEEAIESGFYWDETTEGADHWIGIYKNPPTLLDEPYTAQDYRQAIIELLEADRDSQFLPAIHREGLKAIIGKDGGE